MDTNIGDLNLYPISWHCQNYGRNPGNSHNPPCMRHSANAKRLKRVHNHVKPLRAHGSKIKSGADHRHILDVKSQLANDFSKGPGKSEKSI